MPTYPPRANSTKKRELLLKRKQELQQAIRSRAPRGQLSRAAEKFRSAQLSLLKAELVWVRESRLRNFRVTELSAAARKRIANIEEQARRWRSSTLDEILQETATLATAYPLHGRRLTTFRVDENWCLNTQGSSMLATLG
jgi:hypothetical protein